MLIFMLTSLALSAEGADWQQLRPEQATATSYLKSNWNKYTENYHPMYVLDGNPKTAWVEGAEGNGEGSVLTLPVSSITSAKAVKLRVRNGYQKSASLLTANAAPNKVTVSLLNHQGQTVATTQATLTATEGWQEIVLAGPISKRFDAVELTVNSVHAGRTYRDTCISDVEIWVHSDVPYNSAAEEAKHARALGWIGERVQAAEYFASKPVDYPYASAQFTWVEKPPPFNQASFTVGLTAAKSSAAALKGPWQRLEVKKGATPMPDGIWGLEMIEAFIPLSQVSLFEADSDQLRIIPNKYQSQNDEEGLRNDRYRGNAHAKLGGGAQPVPVELAFHTRHIIEERMSYTDDLDWWLSFDEGRLQHAWAWGDLSDEMGPYTSARHWTFEWTEGKVSQISMSSRTEYTELSPDEGMEAVSTNTEAWKAK